MQLDDASRRVAGALLGDNEDLNQTRVAFLVAPSFAYAAVHYLCMWCQSRREHVLLVFSAHCGVSAALCTSEPSISKIG